MWVEGRNQSGLASIVGAGGKINIRPGLEARWELGAEWRDGSWRESWVIWESIWQLEKFPLVSEGGVGRWGWRDDSLWPAVNPEHQWKLTWNRDSDTDGPNVTVTYKESAGDRLEKVVGARCSRANNTELDASSTMDTIKWNWFSWQINYIACAQLSKNIWDANKTTSQ